MAQDLNDIHDSPFAIRRKPLPSSSNFRLREHDQNSMVEEVPRSTSQSEIVIENVASAILDEPSPLFPACGLRSVDGDSQLAIRQDWGPPYLNRPFLFAMAVLFVALIIGLEVMDYYSRRGHGLVATSLNLRYLWTYGPTFLFTIVAAYWGQIEYRTKLFMPWISLRQQEGIGNQTLDLNYFSPILIRAIVLSIKNRHYLVTFSIAGGLLLQLMSIVSTGLLSLQLQTITIQETFLLTDKLNNPNIGQHPARDPIRVLWATVSNNLSYPPGTTSRYAVQGFVSAVQRHNSTLEAVVDVLSSDLACEPFEWILLSADDSELQDTSSDTEDGPVIEDEEGPGIDDDHVIIEEPERTSYSVSVYVFSESYMSAKTSITWPVLKNGSLEPEWFGHFAMGGGPRVIDGWVEQTLPGREYMTIATFRPSKHDSSNATEDMSLDELVGIICETRFSLTRRKVTTTTTEGTTALEISDLPNEVFPTPHYISEGDFSESLWQLWWMQYNIPGTMDDTWDIASPYIPSTLSPWFVLLNLTKPQADVANYKDLVLLSERSIEIFQAIVAISVKQYSMPVTNESAFVNGTAKFTENRLCVQQLPLRLLQALLALMVLLAYCVARLFEPAVTRDPGMLVTYAAVLSRSKTLARLLRGSGAITMKDLNKKLLSARFFSTKPGDTRSFSIVAKPNGHQPLERISSPEHGDCDNQDTSKWWCPAAARLYFKVGVLALLAGIVIAVEVVYQQSKKKQGIADIADPTGYVKYTWVFIPASLMVVTGIWFSMMDFEARTLYPFQLLAVGAPLDAMTFDPFGDVSPIILAKIIARRDWGLTALMLATLIMPILTIATSGLYTSYPTSFTKSTALKVSSWFYLSQPPRNESTRIAASATELVQFQNITFPKWTHEGLAFPQVYLEDEISWSSSRTLFLRSRVPALRAQFNCTLADFQTNTTVGPEEDFASGTVPKISITTPPGFGSEGHESLHLTWRSYYDGASSTFASALCDFTNTSACTFLYSGQPVTWLAAGRIQENSRTMFSELALLYCMPYLEIVLADVKFSVPEFTLDAEVAPIADESTATRLRSNSAALHLPATYVTTFGVADPGSSKIPVLDGFYRTIVMGRDATPLEELLGLENVPRLIQRTEELYQQQLAQVLNFNYRLPMPARDAGTELSDLPGPFVKMLEMPILANLTDPGRIRLHQSEVSTRILECVLLTMMVLTLLSVVFSSVRRILPKDPNSIAAKMSLFEGSQLLGMVPEGAECWSNEQLRESGVLRDCEFSLGWWDGQGGRRFGIDVGKCENP